MRRIALWCSIIAVVLSASSCGGGGGDQFTLTVAIDGGTGTGAVTSSPPGINCPGTCSAKFDRNVAVSLTANADPSSVFSAWTGDVTSSANPVVVKLDAPTTVHAAFAVREFVLTLATTSTAGAVGSVTSVSTPSAPVEIDCGSRCAVTLPYNTSVTLTATPVAGSYFGGWTGDCSGGSSICVLKMTAARSISASFTPANIVFSSSVEYTLATLASLGSGANTTLKVLDGADKACQNAAQSAGLSNAASFVAWLSASSRPAPSHFPPTARGWVRTDGRPFADSIAALTSTYQVFYPPVLDEKGGTVAGEERVWSATLANGQAYQASAACQDYTSAFPLDYAATGERAAGAQGWTNQNTHGEITCDRPARLYCFGTAYSAVVPPPPPPPSFRYVFLTANSFDASTSIVGADAKCAAQKGSLPGTYKALLATSVAAAASRFTVRNVPVIRPDNVIVADSDAAFLAGTLPLRAPIDVEAGVVYSMGYVFTGASSPAANGTATCNDWTDRTANFQGRTGFYSLTLSQWFDLADFGCDFASGRIYCLQE